MTNIPMTNPLTQFMSQENAKGIPLIGISGTYGTTRFRLDFGPTATPEQIAEANADAATFNWTPQPAPDPLAFITSLATDPACVAIAYVLVPYYPAIDNYALNPAAVKVLWSQLITQYGSGPLTPTLQTTIEGYAAAAYMPLV